MVVVRKRITMKSSTTPPMPAPLTKLARPSAEKWVATLTEERRRLQDDHEALREREANLREYETRLRALQADIDALRELDATAGAAPATGSRPPQFHRPTSRNPFPEDGALQVAWEKLHRAHELFEAEQAHLRNDRCTVREQEANLKKREEAVAAREQRVAEREALLLRATASATNPPMPTSTTPAATAASAKVTANPFSIARAVFGARA